MTRQKKAARAESHTLGPRGFKLATPIQVGAANLTQEVFEEKRLLKAPFS